MKCAMCMSDLLDRLKKQLKKSDPMLLQTFTVQSASLPEAITVYHGWAKCAECFVRNLF